MQAGRLYLGLSQRPLYYFTTTTIYPLRFWDIMQRHCSHWAPIVFDHIWFALCRRLSHCSRYVQGQGLWILACENYAGLCFGTQCLLWYRRSRQAAAVVACPMTPLLSRLTHGASCTATVKPDGLVCRLWSCCWLLISLNPVCLSRLEAVDRHSLGNRSRK